MSDFATSSSALRNVSDTALWVAAYRAEESERPDALFSDPFARMLAGERGFELLTNMPKGRAYSWPMVVRTVLFDRIIEDCLRDGADLVLNLAAGLDARPYRMNLPEHLEWVEVDLPGMIAYKSELLAAELPRCRLRRVAVDLADAAARRALLAGLAGGARRVLVLTEGLLIYLAPDDVASLAGDLASFPAYRWWVTDLASPGAAAPHASYPGAPGGKGAISVWARAGTGLLRPVWLGAGVRRELVLRGGEVTPLAVVDAVFRPVSGADALAGRAGLVRHLPAESSPRRRGSERIGNERGPPAAVVRCDYQSLSGAAGGFGDLAAADDSWQLSGCAGRHLEHGGGAEVIIDTARCPQTVTTAGSLSSAAIETSRRWDYFIDPPDRRSRLAADDQQRVAWGRCQEVPADV